jgi:two-component system OmpR family response regulator
MATILLVDDDRNLTGLLQHVLRLEGYEANVAGTGQDALTRLRETPHDLVLLDYQLPDATGDKVFRRIRQQSQVPVVMLSGYGENDAVVTALDQGAEDYVVKPFETSQLLARIRAVLRRSGAAHRLRGRTLAVGSVVLDQDSHEVTCGGASVSLTPTEFNLLKYMLRNVGRILTFDQIIEHCWAVEGGSNESVVRVHVSRLRKKLAQHGAGDIIRSQVNVGYGIVPQKAA